MYIFEKYLYFSSFEAGNRVSNSSFKWRKIQLKQFSRTRVTSLGVTPMFGSMLAQHWINTGSRYRVCLNHSVKAGHMPAHRLRRWANIKPAWMNASRLLGYYPMWDMNHPKSVQCWASVAGIGPTLHRLWVKVSCFLGCPLVPDLRWHLPRRGMGGSNNTVLQW